MILETKEVLFRAHVHSLDRRSRSAHDHLEQTVDKGGILLPGTGKREAGVRNQLIKELRKHDMRGSKASGQ